MVERLTRRDLFKLGAGVVLMAGGISYPIANDIRNHRLEKRIDRAEAEDKVRNRIIKDNTAMAVFAIAGVEIEDTTFKEVFDRAVGRVQGGMSEWHEDLLSQEIKSSVK